jgi:lysophospholipase L1-like esterase
MGAKINTDENGFRENEITVNKNLPKIVLLGDSMTFGFGSKITFADYLQRKFYKDFKIENMGVGNTNTIMEINQFFYKYENLVKNTGGGDVNIKYVILNFYINDLEIINLKTNNNFYKDLYLYNLVNYKIKLSKDFNYVDYYKKTFLNKNVKEDTFKKILLLNSYSKEKNFIFLFNFIPDLRNPQNYQFHEEENQIKLFLDNNDIPHIDNLEKFLDKKPLEYWVSTSDPHPNKLGHYLLSLNLISYIEKRESLKKTTFKKIYKN